MAATVRRNIQRSANYVLAVVLFAVALFFAGMSTKLARHRTTQGAPRRRLPRLHRHRRLDRHLPHQPLRLTPPRPGRPRPCGNLGGHRYETNAVGAQTGMRPTP